MKLQDVPNEFSAIQTGNVLGNVVKFVVKSDADGHAVRATTSNLGVQLKVDECNFMAMVEFLGHPKLNFGIYQASRWHVGFVQNLTGGGINFRYGNGNQATVASIAPEVLPCKDAGSVATWYDPSPLSLKPFGGGADEMGDATPLLSNHPARTSATMRYIEMGDAPGTGGLPLQVPCKKRDPNNVAQIGTTYTIGWRDPLDTNINVNQRAALTAITGNLSFKTWLVLSSEANLQNIKRTTLFVYLYAWEWVVDYSTTINNQSATPTGRATLLNEGACLPYAEDAIVTGGDANETVCVKYL